MWPNEKQHAIFTQRFLKVFRVLHFIACRILRDKQKAHRAVQNCWWTASRNPPHFDSEGAFRSWLARVLIDEALSILCESQRADAAEAVVNAS